jgi:hypothetical protein
VNTSRRSFFGLMGMTPLAAKATADAEIAKLGTFTANGLGNPSLGLMSTSMPEDGVAYEKRLIGAADYIKLWGIPDVMEYECRDRARYVSFLDPDIACKVSWSMSVKVMTQRQRNYQREIERIERSGWQQRGRLTLKKLLGFDWPW